MMMNCTKTLLLRSKGLLARELSTLPDSPNLKKLEAAYLHLCRDLDEEQVVVPPCHLKDQLNLHLVPRLKKAAADGFSFLQLVKGVVTYRDNLLRVSVGGCTWSTEAMLPLTGFARISEAPGHYVLDQADMKSSMKGGAELKKFCRNKNGIIYLNNPHVVEGLKAEFPGIESCVSQLFLNENKAWRRFFGRNMNLKLALGDGGEMFLPEAFALYPPFTRDKKPKKHFNFIPRKR